MKVVYWTCVGPTRGKCHTRHKTLRVAENCCRMDEFSAKRFHGKSATSDRVPVRVEEEKPDVE